MPKTMITCAVTGNLTKPEMNQALRIEPYSASLCASMGHALMQVAEFQQAQVWLVFVNALIVVSFRAYYPNKSNQISLNRAWKKPGHGDRRQRTKLKHPDG